MGQSAVAGVGGTRMCDWWFTESAVLIDTAGRYTTQDSDAAVDKAGWQAFLGLLQAHRARQPLNGVLVAIALSDIATASPAERLGACPRDPAPGEGALRPARRARAGLCAVHQGGPDRRLHRFLRGPGSRAARPGLGHDIPAEQIGRGTAALFGAEFELLVERLNQRLFDRLQAERSPDRRTLIAGFPAQVASLASPLAEFLTEAFGGSRLDPAPFLRGVYLTSGTQEGTPVDRLTGAMARNFGIDAQRMPSLRSEQGRSYFLSRLLKDVIFGEATLVARNPAAVRRNVLVRAGAAAIALLVALGGAAAIVPAPGTRDDVGRSTSSAPFLIGGGVLALLLAMEKGSDWGWGARSTLGLLLLAAVLLLLWIRTELRVASPLVELRLLRRRAVLTANVSAFVLGVAMYLEISLITQIVQLPAGMDQTVFVSGLVLVPMSLAAIVSSRVLPLVRRRAGRQGDDPDRHDHHLPRDALLRAHR